MTDGLRVNAKAINPAAPDPRPYKLYLHLHIVSTFKTSMFSPFKAVMCLVWFSLQVLSVLSSLNLSCHIFHSTEDSQDLLSIMSLYQGILLIIFSTRSAVWQLQARPLRPSALNILHPFSL